MKNPNVHIKHLEEPLKIIQELEETQTVQLRDLNTNQEYEGEIKKGDKGFELLVNRFDNFSLDDKYNYQGELKNNLKISLNTYFYNFSNHFDTVNPEKSYSILEGEIPQLQSISFDEKQEYFLRKITPIPKNKLSFRSYLERDKYNYETPNSYLSEVISIHLENLPINIFIFQGEYLILDSLEKINPNIFDKMTFSILISLGFVIGHAPFDEAYTFAYETQEMQNIAEFRYTKLIPSLKFRFSPINANPFSWKNVIGEEEAEGYRNKLKPISSVVFEKLCHEIYKNPQLSHALEILLESDNYNIFSQVICQYAVLEKLKFFFSEKFNKKKELKKLKTNEEGLKFPFKLLSIPLSAKDEATIEFRNKFLHGEEYNIYNYKNGQYKEWLGNEINHDTLFLSIRLATLISQLILKYIGYEGYIVNHAKMLEKVTGITLPEEEYFFFVEEIYQERRENAKLSDEKFDRLLENL